VDERGRSRQAIKTISIGRDIRRVRKEPRPCAKGGGDQGSNTSARLWKQEVKPCDLIAIWLPRHFWERDQRRKKHWGGACWPGLKTGKENKKGKNV